jgi:hypothetical protein
MTETKSETNNSAALAKAASDISKSDYTLLLPLASYHFTGNGSHATRKVGNKREHYNETNLGIGLGKKLSENTEGFILGYNNSFNDKTIVAGANYLPLKTNIGNFEGRLGLTAGVAYTEHGSYAKNAPNISKDKFTPMAGIAASMEHVPTGTGVQATIIPTGDKKNTTIVGVSVTQRF